MFLNAGGKHSNSFKQFCRYRSIETKLFLRGYPPSWLLLNNFAGIGALKLFPSKPCIGVIQLLNNFAGIGALKQHGEHFHTVVLILLNNFAGIGALKLDSPCPREFARRLLNNFAGIGALKLCKKA